MFTLFAVDIPKDESAGHSLLRFALPDTLSHCGTLTETRDCGQDKGGSPKVRVRMRTVDTKITCLLCLFPRCPDGLTVSCQLLVLTSKHPLLKSPLFIYFHIERHASCVSALVRSYIACSDSIVTFRFCTIHLKK